MDGRKLLAIYIRALRACNERRRRREVTQFAFRIVPHLMGSSDAGHSSNGGGMLLQELNKGQELKCYSCLCLKNLSFDCGKQPNYSNNTEANSDRRFRGRFRGGGRRCPGSEPRDRFFSN